jgi:ribosomal protein S18 acetylase RimI-like enzyme
MEIRPLEPRDRTALEDFLRRMPEGDRTFFKEAVDDPGVVGAWLEIEARRWLATENGDVLGYVAVVPLHGRSSHVAEIRLVVDPQRRGQGVGKSLARHALVQAFRLGLSKVVVEVLANQDFTVEMFRSLGFTPEALLEGHVLDYAGEPLDVMILGHSASEVAAAIEATGIADSLPS